MKILVSVLWSVLCIAFGLIPESAMWFVYHLVAPVTELGKIALVLGMGFMGGSLCVLFGVLAVWALLGGLVAISSA